MKVMMKSNFYSGTEQQGYLKVSYIARKAVLLHYEPTYNPFINRLLHSLLQSSNFTMRTLGAYLIVTALACSGTYAVAISPTSVVKRGDYEPVPQAVVDEWINKL